MEISFSTKRLRDICEDLDDSDQDLESISDELKTRLADLMAIEYIGEIGDLYPNLTPNSLNYTMEIENGYKLVFEPFSDKKDHNINADVDWSKVNRIKITEISQRN